MNETVSLDYEIKSPIGRVWHALTDPATLAKWMLFETNDFQAVVGHHFQFHGKAATGWTGVVDCEVLKVDAPHWLSYTWMTEGQLGQHRTTVTWTLTASDNGATQIHLEQTGFDREATHEIGGAKYGWTLQLNQLRDPLTPQDNANEA